MLLPRHPETCVPWSRRYSCSRVLYLLRLAKLSPVCISFHIQLRIKLTLILTALAADPLLVWNYGTMAVLAGIGGALFWLSVRKLDAEEDQLNNLQEGTFKRED